MKGAIILILVLLMGFVAAQSLHTFGYTPSESETRLLQNIFGKIDTLEENDRERLIVVHEKLSNYISYFSEDSREKYMIGEIYAYIDHSLYDPEPITSPTKTNETILPSPIISNLANQF